MKLFITALVLFSVMLGSGCTSVSEAGYYWGNYSYTYLETIQSPSVKSNEKHIKSLRDILAKSKELELKPPPGVSAELAFWLLKISPVNTEAQALFEQEYEAYPESRIFIERLQKL